MHSLSHKMKYLLVLTLIVTCFGLVSAQTAAQGVYIPPELYYLLPQGYVGNINKNFIDTTTSNASINAVLEAARESTFYAYDEEFYTVVGSAPTVRTLEASNYTFIFATEAGVWVPELNQVWFDGGGDDPVAYHILDLNNYTIKPPIGDSAQLPPSISGGDYYNGSVYFANLGLKSLSLAPSVFEVDPVTGTTTTILNSFGGVHLNTIDDVSWAAPGNTSCSHSGEANLFFTTLDLGANGETQFSDAVLPNGVWRFTPSTRSLKAVISRGDILAPNGIHVDPTGQRLFVTDVAYTGLTGPGANSSGSPAIYEFDLDADCNPVNKRLFAIVRSTLADGIKIDNFGRVWTAEYNGIVVRDPRGKELGVFNAETLVDAASFPISNFALAGDKLVVLSGDKIQVIQLAQAVTGSTLT